MRSVLFLITCLSLLSFQTEALAPAPARSAAAIIEKANSNFLKIKDATADLTLDYSLFLFGCSGRNRMRGKGFYKSPDKIKATLDKVTYFARGNRIRKIDEKGKKFYVKLINSLNFGPGFHLGLIPHNFKLSVIKDDKDGIIIQGIPKPGILKHVTKVLFHIDPEGYLLRKLDLTLSRKALSGTIKIDYEKIKGLWVPVGFEGTTAIELRENALVGVRIKLRGKNVKINMGLPNNLFNPGF